MFAYAQAYDPTDSPQPMASPLEEMGEPLAFRIEDPADLDAPSTTHDRAIRTRLRLLEWMQKEALATDSETGETWRLATDEGPYASAPDIAPPPLGFTTAALISSYTSEIRAEIRRRDLSVEDIDVALECFYTAEGSALAGTRKAIVLQPELDVTLVADVDESTARDVVDTAVVTAPVNGALGTEHTNRFALSLNGREVPPRGLAELPDSPHTDPASVFQDLQGARPDVDEPLVAHTGERTEALPGAEQRWSEKLGLDPEEDPGHIIHLRGTCSVRADGLYDIEQKTYSPRASKFTFIAEEPVEYGGTGRAPDPLTYFSVAPAFCLTTHLAEFCEREGIDVDYRIVQDTHFSHGTGKAEPAQAESVDTHVFFDIPGDGSFAQDALRLSEQTCFVHELWRSVVRPAVSVTVEQP